MLKDMSCTHCGNSIAGKNNKTVDQNLKLLGEL